MKWINQLIIGHQVIESGEHRKRVLLAGYFILIYLATGSFWLVLGLFDRFSNNTMTFIGFIINIFCFLLVRNGWFYTGTLLLLARINGVTAYYAWLYPNTSSALFFINCGLGALAIFGHEKRWIGIISSVLSIVLYLIISTDLSQFIIGSPHFHHQASLVLTYISLALLIYFFNYITYQYNRVIQLQNEELAKTNKELDRFVYTASHDLKAPLNSVTGLLNIIKLTDDPKEVKSLFQMIEKSIGSLKKFISDVTDYSRNLRTDVAFENINLAQLVDDIRGSLEFDEKAKKIAWKVSVAKEFTVKSDPYRLRIVINNLLSNAIKYSDLSKPNPQVEISASSLSDKVAITIADNGIGIPSEKLPNLFKMFYRATEKESGSGLGLYIAKESIEKLKGRIELHSIFGNGTTFKVELPRS